ncbi:MAG: hypothetical protein V4616_10920 [Bacteroidota bacterium]
MKFIGSRISHQNKNGIFSVVIAASVERSKETLLATWLFFWTCSGIYFITQLFTPLPKETKLVIAVLLTFWGYYEYRIGLIFLWRKFGYESIKFADDKLVIRDVIRGRGKSREFFIDNIPHFAKLKLEEGWVKSMDQSFWVKGNGYIQFQYQGKLVHFGKQLTDEETSKLLDLVQRELIERKRKR